MKKFINFRCLFLVVLSFTTFLSVYSQNNVIDEVVWVVGDEAILKSEVEEARLSALYEGRKFDGDPYCVIPEELAIQKLYMHQAALDSIKVSDSELLQQVDAMENQYIQAIGSKEKMEEYFNKTASQIREQLRENVRTRLIVQQMQQKIVGDIKLTPAEVRQFYKSLPKDSIPYVPTEVEVQIITQEPSVPQSEIDDVKRRLRDYTERVEKGDSFSTLALLYSEDKNSAAKGGEIGFFGRGQLDPEYANVAFNLSDPTKISKIVKTQYGYHIIQLIEKRGDRINTRHILIKPRIPDASIKEAQLRLDSIADDVRNGKYSFDEAATMLSMDKDTHNNHGILVNEKNSTAKFQMEDLPQEVAKIVDKMSVGEVSKAFSMINTKTGTGVCAVVKLKSRINGHKATVTDDYQSVKDMLLAQKREQIIKKWIVNKQKRTYIRINPNWQKCDFKYSGWIKQK